jgi:hypothetical protein
MSDTTLDEPRIRLLLPFIEEEGVLPVDIQAPAFQDVCQQRFGFASGVRIAGFGQSSRRNV